MQSLNVVTLVLFMSFGPKTTKFIRNEDVKHQWYVIDATDLPLGRLAVNVANILRGKNKPTYTPHIDTGDYVIIINAEKVMLTGSKFKTKKLWWHTGHPGGIKNTTPAFLASRGFSERYVRHAIVGMLQHNILGRAQARKLFIYDGLEHPHVAQKPQKLELTF